MAVKYIAARQNYSGLAADTKPITTAGVLVGAIFHETDTGFSYQFNGSAWGKVFPAIDVAGDGALLTIHPRMHKIHEGQHFTAVHREVLGAGSATHIVLNTPASAVATIHMLATLEAGAAGWYTFSETTSGTVGTIIQSYDNNRTTANTSEVIISHGSVLVGVTSVGTIFDIGITGLLGTTSLGGISGDQEWVLNHSTRYIFQFLASAATAVNWGLYYVEELA